jgi:hypothetical protein
VPPGWAEAADTAMEILTPVAPGGVRQIMPGSLLPNDVFADKSVKA